AGGAAGQLLFHQWFAGGTPPLVSNRHAERLLAEDLDDDPFAALTIPFTIEHPLPGPQVELALGDGQDDFVSHSETPQVGRSVVFAGLVVAVAARVPGGDGGVQPGQNVVPQAGFVVVPQSPCRAWPSRAPGQTPLE